MGYTHYYYTVGTFDKKQFAQVVKDFKKVVPIFDSMGIKLAGGSGEGNQKITTTEICFNGDANCGHEQRNLGITWPAKGATGICQAYRKGEPEQVSTIVTMLSGEEETLAVNDSDVKGTFAGCKLNTRTCGGDCSHETFQLILQMKPRKFDQKNDKGLHFNCTKTAYKPYDLAVIICLIIAKHHLGKDIEVHSDGDLPDWSDGMEICQRLLGYGKDFNLDKV